MRTFDPTPFWRSTVGFDRLFDMLDQSARLTTEESYPPYNIERTGENNYRISLALAGFSPEQVTITAEQNVLTIEGAKPDKAERDYLYQGIATRPFRRVFNLADHVQVKSASDNSKVWENDVGSTTAGTGNGGHKKWRSCKNA